MFAYVERTENSCLLIFIHIYNRLVNDARTILNPRPQFTCGMMKVILDVASSICSRGKQEQTNLINEVEEVDIHKHSEKHCQNEFDNEVDDKFAIKSYDDTAVKASYLASIDASGNRINLKTVLYGNDLSKNAVANRKATIGHQRGNLTVLHSTHVEYIQFDDNNKAIGVCINKQDTKRNKDPNTCMHGRSVISPEVFICCCYMLI